MIPRCLVDLIDAVKGKEEFRLSDISKLNDKSQSLHPFIHVIGPDVARVIDLNVFN